MNKTDVKSAPIDSLTPNPRNPRLIEASIEPVAKSIKEFGFLVPIVVNEENVVLSGHARLEAAKSLGMTEVPIVQASGLSSEQQTAFMLADNRLSENSSYDSEQLAVLLKELWGGDYDVSMTGFNVEEIEAFITSSTSELDDILGIGDDTDADDGDLDDDEETDIRHMHRLVFLMSPDQKARVLESIDRTKKESKVNLSNGEALTAICLREAEYAVNS